MPLWMVRSGKHGEREKFNLEKSIVSVGWERLPDLRGLTERSQLAALMMDAYPDKKPSALANWVGQVWTFAKTMQPGDLAAMSLKTSPTVQFGNVIGDYAYDASFDSGAEHYRKVEWLKAIPRAVIDPDLRYSLGSIMTVCNIGRNDAELRIRALLSGGQTASHVSSIDVDPSSSDADYVAPEDVDLDEVLRDAIRTHIARKFDGHELAELVEAVLQAQGYKTYLSPPGPDGGVDVLAGLGPQGFDGPSLAVQVKSGGIEVDTNTLRLFKTAMSEFHAEHGLIVSWGGFKQPVRREMPREFFKIRMWGEDELIDEILSNYEALPSAMRARLPLKRTWMLMQSGDE